MPPPLPYILQYVSLLLTYISPYIFYTPFLYLPPPLIACSVLKLNASYKNISLFVFILFSNSSQYQNDTPRPFTPQA